MLKFGKVRKVWRLEVSKLFLEGRPKVCECVLFYFWGSGRPLLGESEEGKRGPMCGRSGV